MNHASSGWISLACLVALSAGCAQHVTFEQLRPARVTAPIRRLAVVDLPSRHSEGQAALASLQTELQESGRFELVGTEQLEAAAPAPLVAPVGSANHQAIIAAGRHVGLDAVLITELQFLETDGTRYGTKQVRIGDPEIVAAARYELIDVHTGQILAQDVTRSRPFKGELMGGANDETRVLSDLASEAGRQVAHILVPHAMEVKVQLAHSNMGPGSQDTRKGVAAAQAGNWVEARQHWQAAVEADPDNAAASYNLAIAHEALGEITLARRALEMAGENPSPRYTAARQRLALAEADRRLADRARPTQFAADVTPQLAPQAPVRLPPTMPTDDHSTTDRQASSQHTFWR